MKLSAVLVGTALILILGGCAPLAPISYPPASAPHYLALPYIPQDDFQCGPAAVAMVMTFSGDAVPLATFTSEIYSPSLRGSLQPALVAAGRRHGWLAWEISDFAAILQEVAANRPVIILQNRGLSWKPLWHYAVVVGFDAANGLTYLTSGREEQRPVATRTVLRTWERGGNWGLLLLPPGLLPIEADPDRLLAALAGLERSDAASARPGYQAAVARWPAHAGLSTAYGNLLRQAGEVGAAEVAYRAALTADPDHVPALNNLADLLLELGRLDEAHVAAVAAAAVEGPYRSTAAATLREIERAQGHPDHP
ncbi:MAG: PA2778 family cysteine peptidase [Desulfuromonadales bacterium]|nr:PA2778 family cysteine peptidase [Desulfuromonadales bacterium]